jgi:hypothetical protein
VYLAAQILVPIGTPTSAVEVTVADRVALRVDVALDEVDADASDVEAATVGLRAELLQLDIDEVARPTSGAVEGTRAVGAAILGALLLGFGRDVVGSVVRSIEAWTARDRRRSVKITVDGDCIELSNASNEDQHRALEAFLVRHAHPPE